MLAALIAANYTRDDALNEVRAFGADLVKTPVVLEDPSSTADCLLFGFLHRLCGEPQHAAPLLRAAIDHLRNPGTHDGTRMSVPTSAISIAVSELMDENAAVDALNAYVRFARRTGALWWLAAALTALAGFLPFQGRLDEAQAAYDEGRALGQATGTPGIPGPQTTFVELALLCWRGREEEARALSARMTAEAELAAGDVHSRQQRWLALLELSLGRYRQAYDRTLPVIKDDRLGIGTLALQDFIEAAARCGELAAAREALTRLVERAEASGAHWGLGGSPPARRCWVKTAPRPSTARQSISSSQPLRSPTWPEPTCSTGSGCGASVVGETRDSSSARPMRCLSRWEPTALPPGPTPS